MKDGKRDTPRQQTPGNRKDRIRQLIDDAVARGFAAGLGAPPPSPNPDALREESTTLP